MEIKCFCTFFTGLQHFLFVKHDLYQVRDDFYRVNAFSINVIIILKVNRRQAKDINALHKQYYLSKQV